MTQSIIILILVVVGLAIGVLGTYRRVKSMKTSSERRLVVRSIVIVLLFALLLIFLPLALYLSGLIPRWMYWTALGLFFVFLVLINVRANQRLAKVRREKGSGGFA